MPTFCEIFGNIAIQQGFSLIGPNQFFATTTTPGKFIYASPTFLSCLRGSELTEEAISNLLIFLSCLRGSERVDLLNGIHAFFLSCLRGSEPPAWVNMN